MRKHRWKRTGNTEEGVITLLHEWICTRCRLVRYARGNTDSKDFFYNSLEESDCDRALVSKIMET